jgi:hypothetical protein
LTINIIDNELLKSNLTGTLGETIKRNRKSGEFNAGTFINMKDGGRIGS